MQTRSCCTGVVENGSQSGSSRARDHVAMGNSATKVFTNERAIDVVSSRRWTSNTDSRLVERMCVWLVSFQGGGVQPAKLSESDSIASMRPWEISSRDDLSQWLRHQGFPATRPGNHLSARAQEYILINAGARGDARVELRTHGWQFHAFVARDPLCNACICHLCQLTTVLCGHLNVGHWTFHQPPHQFGDHFHSRRVTFAPPCG